MNQEDEIQLPFQTNPALYDGVPVPSDLIIKLRPTTTILRNDTQRARLAELGLSTAPSISYDLRNDPLVHQCALYEVVLPLSPLTSVNGEPIFQSHIYLFNLIIALEWDPSPLTIQQIRLCAKQTSNFLYDVTNGFMAIGQVVIGGPDLMDGADVQVMCCNRFHPRSWVDALREQRKFMPIRMGRGLWMKSHETLATWDSPEGFRALAHEWGHYAFGLADEYLQKALVARLPAEPQFWSRIEQPTDGDGSIEMAAPDIALAVESLMANTMISEYAQTSTMLKQIHDRYPTFPETPQQLDGPAELPLPLPLFRALQASADNDQASSRAILGWNTSDPLSSGDLYLNPAGFHDTINSYQPGLSIWVYLLKGSNTEDGLPEYVIAQGKMSQRDFSAADQASQANTAAGFLVLGATSGDAVVLVCQQHDKSTVYRGAVESQDQALVVLEWIDVTPQALQEMTPTQPFLVAVIPESLPAEQHNSPTLTRVSVQVTAPNQPAQVRIYPTGQHRNAYNGITVSHDAETNQSLPVVIHHLDGVVFLRWEDPTTKVEQLFICHYSLGGGPGTSAGGRLPITGGSSDGNAMLFFLKNSVPLANSPEQADADEGIRVVTTTLTVGSQQVLVNGKQVEARSYLFSVASNASLQDHPSSLVLYYDAAGLKRGGSLLVYRWANNSWQQLATFAPPELLYVAVPIMTGLEAALSTHLTDSDSSPRVEYFRVFWTPD